MPGDDERSTATIARYMTMPVTAAEDDRRPGDVEAQRARARTMTRPRTLRDPPKYSPTIAPMRLSVVATLRAVKKYGRAFGIGPCAGPSHFDRGVRAHQLERGRLDLGQAAGHVDHDREEDEDRHHHHLRQRVEHAEPVVHERREGDDRDRAGPDRERQQQLAGRHPARRRERHEHARGGPDDEPAEGLEQCRLGRRQERRTGRRPSSPRAPSTIGARAEAGGTPSDWPRRR